MSNGNDSSRTYGSSGYPRTHRTPSAYTGSSNDDDGDGVDLDKIETQNTTPTHVCTECRAFEIHIESSPTSDYSWCKNCGRVTRFYRLDDERAD